VGAANTPSLTWYRRTRVATNYSFPATAAAAAGDGGGDGDGAGADVDAVDKMSCKDAVITQQQQRRDHVTSAASLASGQPINDVGGRARRSTTCCSLNTGFAVTARVCLCRSLSLSLSLSLCVRLDVSVPVRLPTCLSFTRQLQVAGYYINRSPLNLKVRETFI